MVSPVPCPLSPVLLFLPCPPVPPSRCPIASASKKNITSSALLHFITFNGNVCERLHGHNYRVAVEVEGPLDKNEYVIDFIALRDEFKTITDELDHHVLLPTAIRSSA